MTQRAKGNDRTRARTKGTGKKNISVRYHKSTYNNARAKEYSRGSSYCQAYSKVVLGIPITITKLTVVGYIRIARITGKA